MKRILALVLAMMLCLSAAVFAEESGYEKYAELFDLLEADQYGKAHEYIDRLENLQSAQQEGATVTEVEITSENWQEYFELKEEAYWLRNDFDEIAYAVWAQVMCVRDEWADKVVLDAGDVAFEYSYNYGYYCCEVDLDAQTFEFGKLEDQGETEVSTTHMDDHYWTEARWSGVFNGYGLYPANTVSVINESFAEDSMVNVYDNLTITRAKGTLAIAE